MSGMDAAKQKVLIAETDKDVIRWVLEELAKKAIAGTVATSANSAREAIEANRYDLVFLNCRIDNNARTTSEMVARIRACGPEVPVVIFADSEMEKTEVLKVAVWATREGCTEILLKPVTKQKIQEIVDTFLPSRELPEMTECQESCYRIVGKSIELARAVTLAKKVAPTSAPVLINGESGTGKELISYLVHAYSSRSAGPYVRVNCGALNESLLESELFGHEKGAFTGAYMQRKGKFEQANCGTILLDEITETGPRFQAQLLRILEQQDFERVGGNENVKVNVRVISTTNRDLKQEVSGGRFRADLYYRLSGVRLVMPALRERVEDIPWLVWHFVNLHAHECRRRITSLDPMMLEIFSKYQWPGNVRQLRNVVRTCMVLGSGPMLSMADVSWLLDEIKPVCTVKQEEDEVDENTVTLEAVEQKAIINTLRKTSGNQTRAAKILGISDRTLREKMKRYRNLARVG